MFYTFIEDSAARIVCEVLTEAYISEGRLVRIFEEKLETDLGWNKTVAVNSGTSALHLALVLAGIRADDEVICPAQTFVATATSILQQSAKPVFVDIQYTTGNIDPISIESKISGRTKAIIAVHWGGYPCDMDEISLIARAHNLVVIEDAAHAVGAIYKGRPVGSISDFTCFSFQAIKHITTGDGGAVCCREDTAGRKGQALRWFGIDRFNSQASELGERAYDITIAGYKYHLNDYAAALGIANLEGFSGRLARRRRIAACYRESLEKVTGISLFAESPDRESAYWLFGFHVEGRLDFIRALKDRGITASVVHQRIDKNSVFGGIRSDLVNQARFDRTQVHIPLHDGLSDDDVAHIIASIKKGW
jgi:perosamine synthetase